MTKRKLLELCSKLRKNEISKEEILKLKDLSDEEIDIVLKSKDKSYTIELISNNNFRELPKDIQQQLINILNSCEDIYGKAIYIIKVATNKNAISSGKVLELVRIISESQTILQAHKASLIACDFIAISTGEIEEITKIISKYRYEEQLEIAYQVAKNIHIAKSGRTLEVLKLISNAKDKREALRIFYNIVNLSKDIKIEDALENGTINSCDFWYMLSEDIDESIKLLDSLELADELPSELYIPNKNIPNNRLKK